MSLWLSHTYAILGILVSLVGAVLTVIYAREARNAADRATTAAAAAKEAAEAARARIFNVDLLFEATKLSGIVDELHANIGHRAWSLVVDRANKVADTISSITIQTENILTDDARANLAKAGTHFRLIASTADKAVFDSSTDADPKKFRKILGEQKQAIVVAIEQLRSTARSDDV